MDALELCNSLRMEFEGVYENKIPLDALPAKLQDMVLALARQENYSIEYTLASLLVAASTAIGNAVNICIRGGWISNAAMYMILVGRPGMERHHLLTLLFVQSASMMERLSVDSRKIWNYTMKLWNDNEVRKRIVEHFHPSQFCAEPLYPISHQKP